MLAAGVYKLLAGYRHGDGMELGMVNPQWGYWGRQWARVSADASGVSLLQRDGVGHRGRGRPADAVAADAVHRRNADPPEFHLHRDANPARISVRDGDRVLPGLLPSRQRG